MKRNTTIDLTKGVGIFLVILGHNLNPLVDYIYSFHMPLFFLLSGIVHSSEKNYSKFLEKKAKGLLVPYFLFAVPLFLFWLTIGRKFGGISHAKTSVIHSLVGIFVGTDIPGISSIEWGTTLWFLLCLFVVSNLFFFISKVNKKIIIGINLLLILINVLISSYLKIRLPWSILTALIALTFYSFGYLFKEKILETEINKKYWSITCLFIMLSIMSYKINGRVDMYYNNYKNILLFFIGGFSGSLFLINIIKLLPKDKCKWILFLGENSLILLAFHGRAMTILKLIWIVILKKNFLEGTFLLAFTYTCFQILICFPLIIFVEKNIPILSKKISLKQV